jgi:methyl-accepting chemotaxis protein
MDQVAQANAAMVEESTAASRSLALETDQLSQLITQFSVGRVAQPGRDREHAAHAVSMGRAA